MEKTSVLENEDLGRFNALGKVPQDDARNVQLAELRNFTRGDRESKLFHRIDEMHAEIKRLREAEMGVRIPEPLFKTGQTVYQ
jgi:hypothetical protein